MARPEHTALPTSTGPSRAVVPIKGTVSPSLDVIAWASNLRELYKQNMELIQFIQICLFQLPPFITNSFPMIIVKCCDVMLVLERNMFDLLIFLGNKFSMVKVRDWRLFMS